MAIWPYTSLLNYHSVIDTQKYKYFLFWNVQPNCHLAVFNKKDAKISEQPNGNSAIHKSFGHSQSHMQIESEAFKTHVKWYSTYARWLYARCKVMSTVINCFFIFMLCLLLGCFRGNISLCIKYTKWVSTHTRWHYKKYTKYTKWVSTHTKWVWTHARWLYGKRLYMRL